MNGYGCTIKSTYCSTFSIGIHTRLHTHTHTRLTALFPGLPRWASTRKVKAIWISLKQGTVSGSGIISWVICKSAPCSRQITTPATHHLVFSQAGCPSCRPTNSVKALKGNAMHSRVYEDVGRLSVCPFVNLYISVIQQ